MVLPSLSLTSTCAFGVVLPLTTVLSGVFGSLLAVPSLTTGTSFTVTSAGSPVTPLAVGTNVNLVSGSCFGTATVKFPWSSAVPVPMVLPSLSLTSTCAFGVVLPLTTVLSGVFGSLIAFPSLTTGVSFTVALTGSPTKLGLSPFFRLGVNTISVPSACFGISTVKCPLSSAVTETGCPDLSLIGLPSVSVIVTLAFGAVSPLTTVLSGLSLVFLAF